MKKALIETLGEVYNPVKNGTTPVVAGLIVMAVGVLASVMFSELIVSRGTDDFHNQSNQQMALVSSYIRHKDNSIGQLLRDSAALFGIKPDISREEWNEYIEDSRALYDNRELLLIGYAENVDPSQVDSYNETLPAGAKAWPTTETDYMTPITYVASLSPMETNLFGYSMSSDSLRRNAIERARDTGQPSMTGPVKLVQDGDNQELFGVLIYMPIYYGPEVPDSVEARRTSLRGFSYIAMRPKDLVNSIDQDIIDKSRSNFKIFDHDTEKLMYATSNSVNMSDSRHVISQDIELGGRKWTIALESYQPALQRWANPGITFALGIVTSIVSGALLTYLLGARLRRIGQRHEDEIARAKTDLLALASHQLRTPASGVKQYIGMLMEGFAGKLKDDQMSLVEKAYDANERQIEIVNQLLYVAKADADQLRIHPYEIKPYKQIVDVLAGLENQADRKKITINSDLDKTLVIEADPQYFYMIMDNIVTNAVKYSEDGGQVDVKLYTSGKEAVIEVSDKGIGISPEDMPELFNKFHRIDNILSQKEGGTGLGLFLADKLVKSHSGRIEVESEIGVGSLFRIYLPFKQTGYLNEITSISGNSKKKGS